jgi:VanZ family protein
MFLKRSQRILAASAYLILITVLFFLPGSAFPNENWFRKIYLDKWIHAGIFLCLSVILLWVLNANKRQLFLRLLIIMLFYGLGVEIIQGLYIPNRSFDLWDLAFDMTGAVAGVLWWGHHIKK